MSEQAYRPGGSDSIWQHEREREAYKRKEMKKNAQFGLCATCERFQFAESEFGPVFARCRRADKQLTAQNPVLRCTDYDEVGSMSLEFMWGIARYIDKARRAGFRKDGDE